MKDYIAAKNAARIQQRFRDDEPAEGDSVQAMMIIDQARQTAEILKCFRGYTSATFVENGATVTHGEWHFVDLK